MTKMECSNVVGNEISSILYDYDDIAVSVCFEGTDKLIVSSISTINEDATLFGEKIYEMNRNQIIDLMKRNGYKEFDEEEQEDFEAKVAKDVG